MTIVTVPHYINSYKLQQWKQQAQRTSQEVNLGIGPKQQLSISQHPLVVPDFVPFASFQLLSGCTTGTSTAMLCVRVKPVSVFRELVLMPLSRRDIYSPLDFLPGRLEPDESSRLHWGISARSEH